MFFQHTVTFHKTLILAGVATFCFAFGAVAEAAEVVVSPSTGTYGSGQTFTATVQVDPQGESVNAVETTMTFDTSRLSVVSVAKTGSVFSLWTTEPTFSNSAGTISFGGGSPTPFSNRSTLVVVTFRATAEGSAVVDFRDASVLAADGLGTDVYSGSQEATYTIGAATTPTPTPTETPDETSDEESSDAAITFGDPPRAPEIGSQTFLDPALWYATSTGLFSWEIPFDIDAVALDVSSTTDMEPETIYEPPIEEYLVEDLPDGVSYIHVQFQNQVGWGGITHRRVQIDTTPPETFTINIRAGDTPSSFPLIAFEARDGTSGIDRYELLIGEGEPIIVTPDEARLGYLLGELENGTYTITVTAYDRAGNTTVATTPVLITAGWTQPQPPVEETSFLSFLTLKNILLTLLILAVIGLAGYIVYLRKEFARKETKLRKETKEIQDQMEKIFSALRDEIHEQINAINKKPRLSKGEQAAVESLNSALEVSETLIEKEIVDVQKILK